MTGDYEIKKITVDDAPDLQKISRLTFATTFGDSTTKENVDDFLDQAYSIEKLTREIENLNSQFYFLIVNGEIAGYLKLNEFDAQSEDIDDEALEVERIYLTEKFQHQGLGLVLIKYAEKIAREKNKKKMWLGVWEHNYNAQKFYAKDGFKRFSQHDFVVGDDVQTDYLLMKNLE